jgi:hypothetical protein
MDSFKRKQNERDFGNWKEVSGGGRIYWFDVTGRNGGRARYVKEVTRYVKEVNSMEVTIVFSQEIYDNKGVLIEIHEKFPVDKGHKKI